MERTLEITLGYPRGLANWGVNPRRWNRPLVVELLTIGAIQVSIPFLPMFLRFCLSVCLRVSYGLMQIVCNLFLHFVEMSE